MLTNFNKRLSFSINSIEILSFITKICKILKIKNCMTSSMIAYLMLKLFGHKSKFHIGINYDNNKFISHSWIKVGDRIFQTNHQDVNYLKIIICI